MTVALIQPHADDLAYSIGGCMLKKMFGPSHDIIAITVFSKSESSKQKIDYITETRKAEDEAYFKSFGIRHIDLDFSDSSIRPFHRTDNTFEDVKRQLHKLIPQKSDIFLPMAIGYHIDHVIVREACIGFKNKTYYEDVPYVFRYNPKIEENMKCIAVNISDVISSKIARLGFYESQMDENILTQVSQRKVERMWFYESIF